MPTYMTLLTASRFMKRAFGLHPFRIGRQNVITVVTSKGILTIRLYAHDIRIMLPTGSSDGFAISSQTISNSDVMNDIMLFITGNCIAAFMEVTRRRKNEITSPERVTVTTFLKLATETISKDTLKKEFQSIYPAESHTALKNINETKPRI